MKKSVGVFIIFAVSFCGFILPAAYAQERRSENSQAYNWEEISGQVDKIDLDCSTMVVKVYSGEEKSAYQEVEILITKEARIVKNGQALALKDLKTRDNISVRYIATDNGKKQAYYIWVK